MLRALRAVYPGRPNRSLVHPEGCQKNSEHAGVDRVYRCQLEHPIKICSQGTWQQTTVVLNIKLKKLQCISVKMFFNEIHLYVEIVKVRTFPVFRLQQTSALVKSTVKTVITIIT